MARARQTQANHFPVQSVQRREQGCGSVAFGIVSHGSRSPRFHRKARLGAIENLNLALFIHAQHKGVFRRIEIESHYVLELVNKMSVSAQLEGTNSMRLQPVGFPDALDSGWTQPYHRCQASRAPMRGPGRLLLQRPLYNFTHLSFLNSPFAPGSTPILEQTGHPVCLVAITPPGDRRSTRPQLLHDLPRRHAIGAKQHDARPQNDLLRCIPISYYPFQLPPVFVTEGYSFARSHTTSIT